MEMDFIKMYKYEFAVYLLLCEKAQNAVMKVTVNVASIDLNIPQAYMLAIEYTAKHYKEYRIEQINFIEYNLVERW